MAELRAAFEEIGFAEVATYIQSGNVLFEAQRQRREGLAGRIETELSRRFDLRLKIVLLTEAQLKQVVEGAPPRFGAEGYLHDVIFLRRPLTVKKAISVVETREGVDRAWPGKGVVYFARLASKASGSRISRVVARPEYQNMTIRSWSTATKLLGLTQERKDPR